MSLVQQKKVLVGTETAKEGDANGPIPSASWEFGALPEGRFTVLSDSSPTDPQGPPIEGTFDFSFYEGPKATEPSDASSLDVQELRKNPVVQGRLRIAMEVEKLKKSEVFLAMLDEAEKKKNIPPEVIQAHRELIFKQTDLVDLQKKLFLHMSSLLHPEGTPVSGADYTQAVNGLFEIFFEKLPGNKVYFTSAQIEKILAKGPLEREALFLELNALASVARADLAPTPIETKALPAQIKDWLAQTENLGFKNSVVYETEQFQAILKSLKEDKKPTFHCENLIKNAEEIQSLIKEGKFEEAKKKYLGEYFNARKVVLELHKEYEQTKKITHYTVGIGIVVAAGFLAALTQGATTPLLVQAGARLSLAKVGGALANGLTFVTTERLLNKIFLGKDLWDPKKTAQQNAGDFALKSLFMAALGPYLREVVHASRTASLLPEIAKKGLPRELLKDGVLDLTRKESKHFLAQLFEKEIGAMSKFDRILFKGWEFKEEVYAFMGWELLESQITLLAEGKKPSLENLKIIEAILSPQAMPDRVAFLAALKTGNRLATPFTQPLSNRLNAWIEKKIEAASQERVDRTEHPPTEEASTGERGPVVVPPREANVPSPVSPPPPRPLRPAAVTEPSEMSYSRGPSSEIPTSGRHAEYVEANNTKGETWSIGLKPYEFNETGTIAYPIVRVKNVEIMEGGEKVEVRFQDHVGKLDFRAILSFDQAENLGIVRKTPVGEIVIFKDGDFEMAQFGKVAPPSIPQPTFPDHVTSRSSTGESYTLRPHRMGEDTYSPETTYATPKGARTDNTVEGSQVTIEFHTLSGKDGDGTIVLTLSKAEVERLGIPLMFDGKLDQSEPKKIPTFALHRAEPKRSGPSNSGGWEMLLTLGIGLTTLLSSEPAHAIVREGAAVDVMGPMGLLTAGALVTLGIASSGRGGWFGRVGRWIANFFSGPPAPGRQEPDSSPPEAPHGETPSPRMDPTEGGPEANHPYRSMSLTLPTNNATALQAKISEINANQNKNALEKSQAIAKLVEDPQFSHPENLQTIILAVKNSSAGGGSKTFLLEEISGKLPSDPQLFRLVLNCIAHSRADVREAAVAEGGVYSHPNYVEFSGLRNRLRRMLPFDPFISWGLAVALRNPNLDWTTYELALDKIRLFQDPRNQRIFDSILEIPHPHRQRYLEKLGRSSPGNPSESPSGGGRTTAVTLGLGAGLITFLSSEPAQAIVQATGAYEAGGTLGLLAAGGLALFGMAASGKGGILSRIGKWFTSFSKENASARKVEKASFELTDLNTPILQGDMEAIQQGGVYYVIEAESVGGNAGPMQFAINAFVDPQSGKITGVGNPQNVPSDIIEKGVSVTFVVRFPTVNEMFKMEGGKKVMRKLKEIPEPIITDVLIPNSLTDPNIRRSLEILKGKTFRAPVRPSPDCNTFDGRKKKGPGTK